MALLFARRGMALSTKLLPQVQSARRVTVVAGAAKEEKKESKVVGKSVLAQRLAEEHSHLTAKQAGDIIDVLLDEIMLSVAEGQDVTIPGFGSFKKRTRAARTGRNPSTGEPLNIPETDAPSFSAGTVFKGVVKTGSWEAYDELVLKQKEEKEKKNKNKKK